MSELNRAEALAPSLRRRTAVTGPAAQGLQLRAGGALLTAFLICVLVAQGWAIAHSMLFALPLVLLLLFVLAPALPPVPVVGSLLTLRVLVDALPESGSRYSTAVELPGFIAVALIAFALGLLWRRRRGLPLTLAAAACLCLWTLIMLHANGVSAVSLREGLREASLLAVVVIVVNARGAMTLRACTRLIQVAGFLAAVVALVQLATHSGMNVAGDIRSNGTFSHPNAAAVYFALATVSSLWRWLELGRGRFDAACALLFAAACLATFSLAGVGGLIVMVLAFGVLRSGSRRFRATLCVGAAALAAAFVLTPVGADRIADETAVQRGPAGGSSTSSLDWRVEKWRHLIEEWKREPLVGHGLGWTTITTSEEHPANSQLPHNEYIRYLVETGAAGLALLLAGLGALAYRLLRKGRRLAGRSLAGAVIAGLLVNALAANTLLYTPAAYAAVAIVAAVTMERVAARAGSTAKGTPDAA